MSSSLSRWNQNLQKCTIDRPFPENTVGGTESYWVFPLNHRNVLGKGFLAKLRELPRSLGIPGEFPGNMQRSKEMAITAMNSGFCSYKNLACIISRSGIGGTYSPIIFVSVYYEAIFLFLSRNNGVLGLKYYFSVCPLDTDILLTNV